MAEAKFNKNDITMADPDLELRAGEGGGLLPKIGVRGGGEVGAPGPLF